MFEGIVNLVKASRPLQFALVFLAGGIVAAVFYPTKHIEEKLKQTFDQQTSVLKQEHDKELSKEEEKVTQLTKEYSSYRETTDNKINSLTTQVTTLKLHQKKTYYKIVHPDGTVEVRASTDTDSEENQQVSQQVQEEYQKKLESDITKLESIQADKIASLQKSWDTKEQDYTHQIATLEQSKVIDINPKNLTVDVGVLTSKDYYGHVTYGILGPIIFGLQGQFGASSAAGAGLGLKF